LVGARAFALGVNQFTTGVQARLQSLKFLRLKTTSTFENVAFQFFEKTAADKVSLKSWFSPIFQVKYNLQARKNQ
jgi:hypothetical protein